MTRPTILVTGGAGFIGSHACKTLARAGYQPLVYDDLSNGIGDAVRWGPLAVGGLADAARLAGIFAQYRPVAVLHFAACIEAGLSVREPARFYENNVTGLPVPMRHTDRRPGDPAILVADNHLARAELGWQPRFPDITDHIRHTAAWMQRWQAN